MVGDVVSCGQVMDEADRLLDDNFGDQLATILQCLPVNRQTLLFSATMSDSILELKDAVFTDPFVWIQDSRFLCIY